MSEEIIYSNKEAQILLSSTEKALSSVRDLRIKSALLNLAHILRYVRAQYRSLSEGYFKVLIDKKACPLNEHQEAIINMLFMEDLYKLPLHINDSVVGYIAQARLKIGK